MVGVLTATRLLGWRAYKVKQLIDAAYRPAAQDGRRADSPG